jgi:NodT family efflux transporter outer membrane factor (OMF) lipoprotein
LAAAAPDRGGAGSRTRCRRALVCTAVLGGLSVLTCGCTSWREYIHNGFKVGPNYHRPPVPVAPHWIDAADVRVRSESDDLSRWWAVFNDPILDSLVCFAYHQNLSLRAAGMRVLEARAQLAIDTGNLFPQMQTSTGDFKWYGISTKTANNLLEFSFPSQSVPGFTFPTFRRWFGQWDLGFNLTWELDFWGRFRRAIEEDADNLDASVANYDNVLVTLLGDVATNYVQMRTFEQRIRYAQHNVELQREQLNITETRFHAGTVSALDVAQARSTLEQTQALIPALEISLQQTTNQLCILLGIPPEELAARLGYGPIPTAPPEVAAGIPADLLRRRPDVRRAEFQAAAQCAAIGVAEAEFYPHIAITGTLQYSAERFKDVFNPQALNGNVGPSLQWNILNYGRIVNNVRLQDARFQELIATYQNTVLSAARDVENGLVMFLRAQKRTRYQRASVEDGARAVRIATDQYQGGRVDLTRVTQLELNLVQLQDTLAQAEGDIALGLIQVYRSLGGGWQLRCTGCTPTSLPPPATPPPAEPAAPTLPPPRPMAAPEASDSELKVRTLLR